MTQSGTARGALKLFGGIAGALVVVGSLVVPAAPASAAVTGSTILNSWEDFKGRSVFVREGAYDAATKRGFGMKKIRTKHNVKLINSLKFATNNPNGGTAQGEQRRYDAYANKLECTNGKNCHYTDSRPFRVIMDNRKEATYYGVNLRNDKIGINTAYCQNDDKSNDCPDWVDTAFQKPVDSDSARARSLTTVPEGTPDVSVTLSYEPLGPVTVTADDAVAVDDSDAIAVN